MTDALFDGPDIREQRSHAGGHVVGGAGVRSLWRRTVRLSLWALATLLLVNGCFLAIRLGDGLLARDHISSALLKGFERGAMGVNPYPRNVLAGRDGYSDCITAQIAVLGDRTLLKNALAPRLMSQEQVGHASNQHNACEELLQYLDGSAQPLPGATYTRFWHGAATALNMALLALPLDGYKALLLDLTLGLIAATAVCAALAGKRLLAALAPLLLASFAFGGQVGYAQLISYGPAAIATWCMALALIVERNRMSDERVVRFAVTAGALEAFFDQMISVPLAAGIFVVVAGAITAERGGGPAQGLSRVGGIVIAWGCGLIGSYAIKLGLSVVVLGPSALSEFVQQIAYRAGTVDAEIGLSPAAPVSRVTVVGLAMLRSLVNIWRLGYTDAPGMFCVTIAALGITGWVFAATSLIAALRERRAGVFLNCGAGYIAASLVIVAWFVLFPEHVARHSFTVRAALIWIIGGWGWFLCGRLTPSADQSIVTRGLPS